MLFENPYVPFSVATDRTFFGRESELAGAMRGLCSHHPHSLFVVGGRKIGKTSFLKALASKLATCTNEFRRRDLPVEVDLNEFTPWSPEEFYEACIIRMKSAIDALARDPMDSELPAIVSLQQFRTSLQTRSMVGSFEDTIWNLCHFEQPLLPIDHVTFLIDEFDQTRKWREQTASALYVQLRHLITSSPRISVVFAGSASVLESVGVLGSPLATAVKPILLGPLERGDVFRLITEPLRDTVFEARFAISDIPWFERIWDATGGHPYLVQRLMHCLCNADCETIEESDWTQCHLEFMDVFLNWYTKLDSVERRLYSVLASASDSGTPRMTPKDLQIKATDCDWWDVTRCLRTLISTGLVRMQGDRDGQVSYEIAGALFKNWVQQFASSSGQLSEPQRRHLETKKQELDSLYSIQTQRIHLLETDINREIDSDRKLSLKSRIQEIMAEREQVVAQLDHIEEHLRPYVTG